MAENNMQQCSQCRSIQHEKKDCPVYKITSKFAQIDSSYGYHYKHYDIPVYDTHCHLDIVFDRFKHYGTFKNFMEKEIFPDNFKGCIVSFSDPVSFSFFGIWDELLKEEGVWGTFGIHPHHARDFNDKTERRMLECLSYEKAVAVGECGLDYSLRCHSPVNFQNNVFRKHIKIAKDVKKPLVIHSRDAEDDVYDILCEEKMQDWPIHVHCFTGNHSQLHRFINEFENMYFGFTNVIAYPTATQTHDVVKSIPLDRVLLETDAPYFVPNSLKDSEQFSHPGNVLFVAEEIARLKNQDVDVILDYCRRNVRKLYNI